MDALEKTFHIMLILSGHVNQAKLRYNIAMTTHNQIIKVHSYEYY